MRRCWPVLVLALCAAGCGYALVGRGSSLPDHIRRIGVPMFENQSDTPDLDRAITEAVRQELQSRGRYLVVQDATGVDAVLTGTVRPVTLTVAAFTGDRQASRYLLTVHAAVEFRDTRDNRLMWSNPALRVSDEYDVTGSLAVNDPAALFSQDQNALTRLARVFARSLVASILEAF